MIGLEMFQLNAASLFARSDWRGRKIQNTSSSRTHVFILTLFFFFSCFRPLTLFFFGMTLDPIWMASIAASLFVLYKVVEGKYLEHPPALRTIVRDAIAVFAAVYISSFVVGQSEGDIQEFVQAITDAKTAVLPETMGAAAAVFTDDPGF